MHKGLFPGKGTNTPPTTKIASTMSLSEKQFKRTRLAEVMSYEAFTWLDVLLIKSQSEFPYPIPAHKWFSTSKGSNLLTAAIVKFLQLSGHHAERINTMGQYRKTKSGMKWIPSGSTPGSADIHAVINGRFVAIEIKFGRDRQSVKQKKYQAKIEKSGAKYIVAKSLDDVINSIRP